MKGAEVVRATHQEHTGLQGNLFADQGAIAAGEHIQALAEGRIQTFDVSGVDTATSLYELD